MIVRVLRAPLFAIQTQPATGREIGRRTLGRGTPIEVVSGPRAFYVDEYGKDVELAVFYAWDCDGVGPYTYCADAADFVAAL